MLWGLGGMLSECDRGACLGALGRLWGAGVWGTHLEAAVGFWTREGMGWRWGRWCSGRYLGKRAVSLGEGLRAEGSLCCGRWEWACASWPGPVLCATGGIPLPQQRGRHLWVPEQVPAVDYVTVCGITANHSAPGELS